MQVVLFGVGPSFAVREGLTGLTLTYLFRSFNLAACGTQGQQAWVNVTSKPQKL